VAHLLVRGFWAFSLFPTLIQRNDAFPSLASLDLQNIDFSSSLPPPGNEVVREAFLAILRARSSAGIPVRRVTLKSCVRVGRWIELFREVVNDVAWEFDTTSDSDSQSSSSAFEHDWDNSEYESDHDSDDSDGFEGY
jgi:hypothetical protein